MSQTEAQPLSSTELVARISAASRKKKTVAMDTSDPSLNDEERKESIAAQEETQTNQEDIKAHLRVVTSNPRTPNKQEKAEEDAKLDEVNHKLEIATEKMDLGRRGSHNLIKLLTQYGHADEDARFVMREDALAQGVQSLEALDVAIARLSSLRKDTSKRLTGAFGFDAAYLKLCIKQRKEPVQLVMEFFRTTRREVDKLHDILEVRGIHRKGDEDTKSAKKKARG